MSTRIAARILVLTAILVGCSESFPNRPAALEPSLPTEGTRTATGEVFKLADFSLTLPDTMAAVDFTSTDFERQAASMNDRLPNARAEQLAEMVGQFRKSGRFKLLALDIEIDDPVITDNLNIIVGRAPARATQARFTKIAKQSLAEIGAEILSQDSLVSNGHSFDRVRSRIAGAPFENTAYLLLHQGKTYTITLTAKAERADAFFAQGETIMRSFRAR